MLWIFSSLLIDFQRWRAAHVDDAYFIDLRRFRRLRL